MSSGNDKFWRRVRQKYENDVGSVAEICAEFKITPGTLYNHRRSEGWRMRRGRGACAGREGGALGHGGRNFRAETLDSHGAANEASVGARLFEVLEIKLAEIEARILMGEELSAAENEREQRVIGNLIKNFDKLTEFNERRSYEAAGGEQSGKRQSVGIDEGQDLAKLNAVQFREEIARRIEHFEKAGKP